MDSEARALLEREFERHSAAHYSPVQRRGHLARREGRDPALWSLLCDHGWTALGLAEAEGGLGDSVQDVLPLLAAAGRDLWREPLLEWCGSTIGALRALPANQGRAALLREVVSGTGSVCFAHREAAFGFAFDTAPAVTADREGHLHGTKCCVVDYTPDSALLVTARDRDGESLYLVPPRAQGIAVHAYRTVDGRRAGDLRFDAVPARALGPARAAVLGAHRRSQIFAAGELVGVMRGALAHTRGHLQTRHQFGRPLAAQQVLQHRLVDMHMAVLETAALVAATAQAYDAEAPDLDRRLLILRAHSARAARVVTQQAIQLHGGLGLCAEIAVGHHYRRTLALDSLCGTADWALSCLAATEAS